MSEVKRYWVPQGSLDGEGWHQDDNEVVLASEHDRVLAALREELAVTDKEVEGLQSALSDSEKRNADQLALLHMSTELLSTISLHRAMAPNDWCDSFKNEVSDRLEKLRAFLAQPTESGASE